jgi:hypothetical protein
MRSLPTNWQFLWRRFMLAPFHSHESVLNIALSEANSTKSMPQSLQSFSIGLRTGQPVPRQDSIAISTLASQLEVGDVVFIRIPFKAFSEVAAATGSWTNHVGVVVEIGSDPVIAESRFPLSGSTALSRFVARSEGGRVAVARLRRQLSLQEKRSVMLAAQRRSCILYDTGFNLHSRRQFCSRYVREVLEEATGMPIGDVETFAQLLASYPNANLAFWRLWYFGRIPWNRKTVTPASLIRSRALAVMFDGIAVAGISA